MINRKWFIASLLLASLGAALSLACRKVEAPAAVNDDIQIVNPKKFGVSTIPAQRVPLGIPGDYKPVVAMMPDGELLLVAFHQDVLVEKPQKIREYIIFFRSKDGGVTWGDREVLAELLGREPYLTVLKDGTIFITVHFLPPDVRNHDGYTHAYIHRSIDRGKTWTTTRIGPEGFPPKAQTLLSRNVLALPDGTLLLGVDYVNGPAYLWRSADNGATWKRSEALKFEGWHSEGLGSMIFGGEGILTRTESGKILIIARVDSHEWPIGGRKVGEVPAGRTDNADHLILYESTDGGKGFRNVQDFSDYGQMYPSILRLEEGRLLLTFTQRELKPPLGLRAVLGEETPDGIRFDYDHDVLVLDQRTPQGKISGGGFGRTVQLTDGTLVSSYSYRGADNNTYLEVVRWKLPAGQ